MSPLLIAVAVALVVAAIALALSPRLRCRVLWHAAPRIVRGRESHAEATRNVTAVMCPRCELVHNRQYGAWYVPPRRASIDTGVQRDAVGARDRMKRHRT